MEEKEILVLSAYSDDGDHRFRSIVITDSEAS